MHRPILVVEDDHDIRETLRTVLEEEGYTVITAANGREALDWMTAEPRGEPCLVVLDLMMPVMSGWEFVQHLYAADPAPTLPICVVSAFGDRAPPEARAVLRKPIDLEALLQVVGDYC